MKDLPYHHAMDKLRKELLPISYIELSHNQLILGGNPTCTSLDHKAIGHLIASLVCIQQELHERQMP